MDWHEKVDGMVREAKGPAMITHVDKVDQPWKAPAAKKVAPASKICPGGNQSLENVNQFEVLVMDNLSVPSHADEVELQIH